MLAAFTIRSSCRFHAQGKSYVVQGEFTIPLQFTTVDLPYRYFICQEGRTEDDGYEFVKQGKSGAVVKRALVVPADLRGKSCGKATSVHVLCLVTECRGLSSFIHIRVLFPVRPYHSSEIQLDCHVQV